MNEQVLDIPIGKGLAEGFDAKILPFGNAAKLENFESLRTGGITKRKGWGGRLTLTTFAGDDLLNIYRIDGADGVLRLVSRGTDLLPHLYTYVPGADRWSDQDSLSITSVRRTGAVSVTEILANPALAPFGNDRFRLLVWSELGSATYYKVVDASANATVVQRTTLVSGTSSKVRVVPVDDDVWILYNDRFTGFRALKIDGSTLATTNIQIDATNAEWFDANLYSAAELVFAYAHNASSTLRMGRINNTTNAVASSGTYVAAGTVTCIAVCGSSTVGVQVLYHAGAAHDVTLARFTTAYAIVAPSPHVIEAAPAFYGTGVGIVMDGTTALCAYELAATAAHRGRVKVQPVLSGGGLTAAREAHRCALASGLVSIGGRAYALLAVAQDASVETNNTEAGIVGRYLSVTYTAGSGITDSTKGSAPIFHVVLACVDDPSASRLLPVAKVGTINAFKTFDQAGAKLWPTSTSEEVWIGTLTATDGVDVGPIRMDQVRLDVRAQQPALYHEVRGAGGYAVGGGLPLTTDGTSAVELSFLQAPVWEEPVIAAGGLGDLASSPSGTAYAYRARYEWFDEAGRQHVSPWSPDLVVTLIDAASGTYTVQLHLACTQLSRRGRAQFGSGRDAVLAIYRSVGNGASASGDVVFYRLFAWSAFPRNGTTYSVSVTDGVDDAGLLALELGQTVSPGGTLAPICPPASAHLCAHRGRWWLASGETGRDVWASLPVLATEQPVFPPEFRIELPDPPDAITALASLDDKLVIFTATRIYYLTGDGPADNGSGESWPQPWLVTAQHGCVDARSLVTTPEGVFFQTSAGIALLNRGLQVTLAGESIRDLIENRPVCLAAAHDPTRSRALWLLANADGETIGAVYDYLHQIWSRQDTTISSELRGMTLWGDLLVVGIDEAMRSEAVPSPSSSRGLDREGDFVWVTGVFETPWICPGGPGAYQRMRRLILLGEKLSGCSLRVQIYLNFDATTVAQTHEIDLTAATVVAGLPLLRYEVPLNVQASQAIKIRLTDLPPPEEETPAGAEPRAGIALQRMALEYLPERGTPRLPATNRGGGT